MIMRTTTVGVSLVAVFSSLLLAQTSPQIQVSSEEVVFHVRFTDRFGKAISNIRPDEVKIYEDGKEQKLRRLFRSEEPFDVSLLLDVSPSTYDIQEGIRERSIEFVQQMPELNRMLLISFDDKIYIDCDWTSDLQKVMDTIEELHTNEKSSSTHLYEAISLVAEKKLTRKTPRRAMIVYTDGIDHGSNDFNEKQSLEIIEESGIVVYPIQYDSREWYARRGRPDYDDRYPPDPNDPNDPRNDPSDPRNRDPRTGRSRRTIPPPTIPGTTPPTIGGVILGPTSERDKAAYEAQTMYNHAKDYLFKLAQVSAGRYFETPRITMLGQAYSKIIDELAHVYTVTYIPSPIKHDGLTHRVRIDVTRPDVAVLTTKGGYRAKTQ
jgi:hypothetical protein